MRKWTVQMNDTTLFKGCDKDEKADTACKAEEFPTDGSAKKPWPNCWTDADGTENPKQHMSCILSM